jgi:single-strand DNA-binding protein
MSGSVNKVIIVGNAVRDPEVRHTSDGKPIVNLTVATSESWRDKTSGERKEKAEFHRVVIFNEHIAKVAEQYVKKGTSLYIEGQLQTRKWTDKDGAERYSTEIVLQGFNGTLTMLGKRSDGDGGSSGGNRDDDRGGQTSANKPAERSGAKQSYSRDLDDEVPF